MLIELINKKVRVIGNGTVNIHKVLPNVDLSKLHFKEDVNYEVLKSIMETTDEKNLVKVIKERMDDLDLEDWQKDLVREGLYDPENFEEDDSEDEDDYYHEDDE